MNKFDRDLEFLSAKLNMNINHETQKKLDVLKDKLIRMHNEAFFNITARQGHIQCTID